MSLLEVAGARLYYEMHGRGPTLVLVPGAKGTAEVFRSLVAELRDRFQVVVYDRRGYSRSTLDRPVGDRRLADEAEDLRALVRHVTDGPAMVFGNSSGAIVAVQLLLDHPDAVDRVVAHEPPTMTVLPDADRWLALFDGVYDTYRTAGIPAAMRAFAAGTFGDTDRRAMHRHAMRPDHGEHRDANTAFWLEHELRQYPRTQLDLDTLAGRTDRLVLAAGRQSRGYPTHRTASALAERLGLTLVELPGGHIGCVTEPAAFATALTEVLACAAEAVLPGDPIA